MNISFKNLTQKNVVISHNGKNTFIESAGELVICCDIKKPIKIVMEKDNPRLRISGYINPIGNKSFQLLFYTDLGCELNITEDIKSVEIRENTYGIGNNVLLNILEIAPQNIFKRVYFASKDKLLFSLFTFLDVLPQTVIVLPLFLLGLYGVLFEFDMLSLIILIIGIILFILHIKYIRKMISIKKCDYTFMQDEMDKVKIKKKKKYYIEFDNRAQGDG